MFVIVTHVSLNHVNVASTFPLVSVAGLYETVAVGDVLSIRVTVAVVLHVFHTRSVNVNTKLPFHVNVCPVAFNHVRVSEYHVSVAITFQLVSVAGL